MLLFPWHLEAPVPVVPSLYVREKNPSGQWRYRRVKEGRGIRTSELKAPFYARPFLDGNQVWKTLSAATFSEAKEEAERLAVALDAQARGLTVAQAESLTNASRTPIKTAVETYLEQKSGKARKTVAQYRLTLNEFMEALGDTVRFLDEIDENVLRRYKKFLVSRGHAGKTIDTRLNIVFFVLKKNGIKARIPRDEMPVVEDEIAVPYTDEELRKLFAHMNEEETARYKFFLGTGCRDKEVTFAAWNDIDFDKKTYHVRRKEDVGFTPKSHESRTIPLPDSLIALLKERHKNAPHDRWIFVNQQRKPDNHFLRKLKTIALRAGLNCGQCRTTITEGRYERRKQVEVSCKTRPVCQHFYLHRFRKTCASRWEQHGVPIRTIQHYLGHKNLETTMLYLGIADSEKLRGNINAAFGD
jgi:integrase/recombinase XerD